MQLRWVGVGVLGLAGLAIADEERPHLLSDAQRNNIGDSRVVQFPAELTRHYEGLKQFARGRLLERGDRLPEAVQAYEAALRSEPDAVELMRICVPLQFKLERTVSALRLMRQALRRQPDQPDLWLRYAQELLELQRHEDAIRTVRQALQSANFQESPAFQADLHVVEAAALEALQQPTGAVASYHAVASYQQALRIIDDRERYLEDHYAPTAAELPLERAKLLERLARAQLKAGLFESAMASFREAEATHSLGPGRLQLNLAEVSLAAGKAADALRHVFLALESKPRSDEAFRLLAKALRQGGREADIVATLEKLHEEKVQETGLRLVLAEEYVVTQCFDQAERLYREIMTVEPVPIPDACRGYVRLLLQQGKGQQALEDYQGLCRRPQSAGWARAMTLALLGEPRTLQSLLTHVEQVELSGTMRLLLLKMAVQAQLWRAAETLARLHVAKDPKPTEAFLLHCQSLLAQRKYRELVSACQNALQHDGVLQPLVFQLELAKALALTRQGEPAMQAVAAARRLAAAKSTDEHKVLCTELYVLHLLGRHHECQRRGEELLQAELATGPWARQVRYVLAHAYEASSLYDQALAHLASILANDANDDEAAAAKARVLYLQNQRLDEAEYAIREAIELDYVAQLKRNKTNPVPTVTKPNAAYQATLGAIVLRSGRTVEGVALLTELVGPTASSDPWVHLCVGDACMHQHRREEAQRHWQLALRSLEESPTIGADLRSSLQARLKLQPSMLTPTSTRAPASSSSPPRP